MGSGVWGEVREGCGTEECGSFADWCPVLNADRALGFTATVINIHTHTHTYTQSTNVHPRDITSQQWSYCQILTMRAHSIYTGSYNETLPKHNNSMTKGFFVSAEFDRTPKNLRQLLIQQKC